MFNVVPTLNLKSVFSDAFGSQQVFLKAGNEMRAVSRDSFYFYYYVHCADASSDYHRAHQTIDVTTRKLHEIPHVSSR